MAVGSIDLFRTAEVVLVATVLVHLCLLRPWNARADLLLTVEMIDKDLTAEIDRGCLPVDDPVVADLQRCLSLSRKRADAAESLANLLALLSPQPRSVPWSREDLWPPSGRLGRSEGPTRLEGVARLDGSAWPDGSASPDGVARPGATAPLDRLTAGEQHILLEYSAELSAATSAYLRVNGWPRLSARQSFFGGGHGGAESVRHGNGARRGWSLPRRFRPVRDLSLASTQEAEEKPQSQSQSPAHPAPEPVEAPRILDLSIIAERDPIDDDELELRNEPDQVPTQTDGDEQPDGYDQPDSYEPAWDEYFLEGRSAADRSLNQRELAKRPAAGRPVIQRPVIQRPVIERRPVNERPVNEPVTEREVIQRQPAAGRVGTERPFSERPFTDPRPAGGPPAERPFSEPAYSQPFPERPFAERYFDEDIFDEPDSPLAPANAPSSRQSGAEHVVAGLTAKPAAEPAAQRPQPERPYQRLSLDRASLDRLAANRLMNENRATSRPRRPEDHD